MKIVEASPKIDSGTLIFGCATRSDLVMVDCLCSIVLFPTIFWWISSIDRLDWLALIGNMESRTYIWRSCIRKDNAACWPRIWDKYSFMLSSFHASRALDLHVQLLRSSAPPARAGEYDHVSSTCHVKRRSEFRPRLHAAILKNICLDFG